MIGTLPAAAPGAATDDSSAVQDRVVQDNGPSAAPELIQRKRGPMAKTSPRDSTCSRARSEAWPG